MLTYEQASDKVIIALDCSRERAFELADMLAGKATWVKVGMTLFYAEGPAIVEAMRERGLRVFLDLKVHDIPFQVQGAVRSAAMTGADIISIHGLGSSAMVSAARKGAEEAAEKCGRERCRLVAISVLTSMDQDALAEIGVTSPIAEEVARLASLSYGAGADGIVCSPQAHRHPGRAPGGLCGGGPEAHRHARGRHPGRLLQARRRPPHHRRRRSGGRL